MDRWRAVDLIENSSLILGTLERGFTRAQAERILAVAAAAADIASERPGTAEIAYRLAYEGEDVPAELVLQHLEDSVGAFQSGMRRFLKRFGGGKLLQVDSVQPLARLIVRAVLKRCAPPVARGILEDGVMVLLDTMLSDAPPQRAPQMFATLVRRIFPHSTPEAPQMLWEILTECMRLLRLDDKNVMIQAVREVNRNERDIVLQTVRDTRLMLAIAAQVFPWMLDAKPLLRYEWFTEEDSDFVKRRFAPCISTILLTARHNAYTRQLLQDVREEKSDDALADFRLLKRAADETASNLRIAN